MEISKKEQKVITDLLSDKFKYSDYEFVRKIKTDGRFSSPIMKHSDPNGLAEIWTLNGKSYWVEGAKATKMGYHQIKRREVKIKKNESIWEQLFNFILYK